MRSLPLTWLLASCLLACSSAAPTSRAERADVATRTPASAVASQQQPDAVASGPAARAPRVDKLQLQMLEGQLAEKLVQENTTDAIFSPDGAQTLLVANQHAARLMAAGKVPGPPVSTHRVLPHRSAFGPDGKSLLVRWYDDGEFSPFGGIALLRAPGWTTVFEEKGASDAFYVDANTIAFRRDAEPMLLDIATGQVRSAGKPLPDFGCTNEEALYWGVRPESTCPDRRWGKVLGMDSGGRWIVVDVRASAGRRQQSRLRAVDVTKGSETILFKPSEGVDVDTLQVVISPDRHTICVSSRWRAGEKSPLESKVECGPVGGPYRSMNAKMLRAPQFLGPGKVLVGADGRPPRIVDMATGDETELIFSNSEDTDIGVIDATHFIAESATIAMLLDLEKKTVTALRPTGQSGAHSAAVDPKNPKHLLLPAYRKGSMKYDLYDVVVKGSGPMK